jgi:hypothetical protein
MEKMDKSLSRVDKLKARVLALKPLLPPGHTNIFIQHYPEYNNKQGLDKYRNNMKLGSADEELIEKAEKLFLKKKVKKKSKKRIRVSNQQY